VSAPHPHHGDDESLRLEREAVRSASAPGEVVARDPDAHRSVAWFLRRTLLRYGLVWLVLVAAMVVVLFLLD
jgi:hypothetical protein